MDDVFTRRGFLPEPDPLPHFPPRSELAVLDQIGRDLPSRLHDHGFRSYARALVIPPWQAMGDEAEDLRALRLYYLRVGFLASGYVNQVGEAPATVLPHNLALPLCEACDRLARPPILSYDGYALYNWRRRDPTRPIALGNIDTLQNFVHLDDEHWFILVHVEIEAIAAAILAAIADVYAALDATGDADVDTALTTITDALHRQTAVLRRIPEKMDPALYYRTFRPYIRFFEDVTYEGVARSPMDYRGESGAQSSVIPAVVAFLKIPHRRSRLTDHLADMRRYMPAAHRALLAEIEARPSIRGRAHREPFNAALDALAEFREIHHGWAREYIDRWVDDPRGTGGTPYMRWLAQLIAETREYRIS